MFSIIKAFAGDKLKKMQNAKNLKKKCLFLYGNANKWKEGQKELEKVNKTHTYIHKARMANSQKGTNNGKDMK